MAHRRKHDAYLADNVGIPKSAFASGEERYKPVYNPIAWPNELRRTINFWRHTRKWLRLCFGRAPTPTKPNPSVRTSQYSMAELAKHKKRDFDPLLPDLELVNHNLKVLSSDGEPLLVFLKGSLSLPFDYQPVDYAAHPELVKPNLPAIGLNAFKKLTAVYNPPKKKSTDSRHNHNPETDADGVETGYYHFAFWQQKGHDFKTKDDNHLTVDRDAALSSDCFPKLNGMKNVGQAGCVVSFFQRMAPITQAIGSLFEMVDFKNYRAYRERYLELVKDTPFSQFCFTQHGCFLGNACLVGLESQLHRDTRDTEDGWVADIAFGDFEGGYLQVPQLGVQLQLEPDDVVFMRSKTLLHGVSHVKRGLRYSMVFFTHAGMVETQKTILRDLGTAK